VTTVERRVWLSGRGNRNESAAQPDPNARGYGEFRSGSPTAAATTVDAPATSVRLPMRPRRTAQQHKTERKMEATETVRRNRPARKEGAKENRPW